MLRPSVFSNNFVGNMFDDFFNDSFWPVSKTRNANLMSTDIQENEKEYCIDMDLPGFAKEEISADLKDGYLTVHAAHSSEKEVRDDKNTRYIRKERYSGQYQRSFYVGDAITEEDIKAKFADGVLTLVVPKKEAKPAVEEKKYISIEG